MPTLLPYDDQSLRQAAERLRAGGVVAFATETVYGLGADTMNAAAVQETYRLKGRPLDNPLIAHVVDVADARRLTTGWDQRADKLAIRFWPGPLTMILARHPGVPPESVAGLPTIAVRSPMHPLARCLLYAFGGAISAPSANLSGHVSPTSAQHVMEDFAGEEDLLVLDGGASSFGIESTVVDLTGPEVVVRRPGSITVEQLRRAVEGVRLEPGLVQGASPGTAASHYAPATPATLVPGPELEAHLRTLQGTAVVLTLDRSRVPPPHQAISMPVGAEEYARTLYRALREADHLGAASIVIEEPPGRDGLWVAVRDRLQRATAPRGA